MRPRGRALLLAAGAALMAAVATVAPGATTHGSVARAAAATTTPADPTMTWKAKHYAWYRGQLGLTVWRGSAHARYVAWVESHNVCTAVSSGGTYRGRWQVSGSFWSGYGGLVFARYANYATCLEQDKIAYRGWVRGWWSPWGA